MSEAIKETVERRTFVVEIEVPGVGTAIFWRSETNSGSWAARGSAALCHVLNAMFDMQPLKISRFTETTVVRTEEHRKELP